MMLLIIGLNRKIGFRPDMKSDKPRQQGFETMALKLSYETPYGLTCADAYWRIKRCAVEIELSSVDPESDDVPTKTYFVTGGLEVFVSAADHTAGKPPIGGGTYRMPLDMDSTDMSNVVAESYKWLKTQAEFSGAEDV